MPLSENTIGYLLADYQRLHEESIEVISRARRLVAEARAIATLLQSHGRSVPPLEDLPDTSLIAPIADPVRLDDEQLYYKILEVVRTRKQGFKISEMYERLKAEVADDGGLLKGRIAGTMNLLLGAGRLERSGPPGNRIKIADSERAYEESSDEEDDGLPF